MKNNVVTKLWIAALALPTLADAASAYYSPRLGRFLSRDPISEPGAILAATATRQPTPFIPRDVAAKAGQHLYAYVHNQPCTAVDPLGLICGIMVYRAKMATRTVGGRTVIDVGHEWIEYPGGSMGFYPSGDDLFDTPGVILMPDPHAGDHSGTSWFTARRTGNWFGSLLGGGEPELPHSDTSCACATCRQITSCLAEFALTRMAMGTQAPNYDLGFYNCRDFVASALRRCCLEKDPDKRAR
jgi:RHS repeat-associated protein